jgi:hypothetical protein
MQSENFGMTNLLGDGVPKILLPADVPQFSLASAGQGGADPSAAIFHKTFSFDCDSSGMSFPLKRVRLILEADLRSLLARHGYLCAQLDHTSGIFPTASTRK